MMRYSTVFVLILSAILSFCAAQTPAGSSGAAPAAGAAAPSNTNTVSLSADVASGIFIGLFLLSILGFAVTMMMGIQTSDVIGQPKEGGN